MSLTLLDHYALALIQGGQTNWTPKEPTELFNVAQMLVNESKRYRTPVKKPKRTPTCPITDPIDPEITGFDAFWDAYPKQRRVQKPKCREYWAKYSCDDQLDTILKNIEESLVHTWNLDEQKFIPLATTYLNQERWKDPICPQKSHAPKRSQQGQLEQYWQEHHKGLEEDPKAKSRFMKGQFKLLGTAAECSNLPIPAKDMRPIALMWFNWYTSKTTSKSFEYVMELLCNWYQKGHKKSDQFNIHFLKPYTYQNGVWAPTEILGKFTMYLSHRAKRA